MFPAEGDLPLFSISCCSKIALSKLRRKAARMSAGWIVLIAWSTPGSSVFITGTGNLY